MKTDWKMLIIEVGWYVIAAYYAVYFLLLFENDCDNFYLIQLLVTAPFVQALQDLYPSAWDPCYINF